MTTLIGLLMFSTLIAAAAFGYINARMMTRMKGKLPPSTLAKGHPEWDRVAEMARNR